MISENDRTELKQIIGNRYTGKVKFILSENKDVSCSGKPYSIEFIRQVFNGHIENLDVELAIYELRDKILAKEAKLKKKKSLTNPSEGKNQ